MTGAQFRKLMERSDETKAYGRHVKVDGYYRHFKGNLYQVDFVAKDANTKQFVVVYHNAFKSDSEVDVHWVRPLDEFLSPVDREKYPNVEQEFRFVEEIFYFGDDEE